MEPSHQPARERTGTELLGWWRLVSCDVEFHDSGAREPMYHTPARGYIVFSPSGRMMTVIEAEGRPPPETDTDHVAAMRSMAAYTGTYRVHADRWVTQVDVSWNAGWTGTEQHRSFHLSAGRLHVLSPWYGSPLHGGRMVRALLIWSRDRTADEPNTPGPTPGVSQT